MGLTLTNAAIFLFLCIYAFIWYYIGKKIKQDEIDIAKRRFSNFLDWDMLPTDMNIGNKYEVLTSATWGQVGVHVLRRVGDTGTNTLFTVCTVKDFILPKKFIVYQEVIIGKPKDTTKERFCIEEIKDLK